MAGDRRHSSLARQYARKSDMGLHRSAVRYRERVRRAKPEVSCTWPAPGCCPKLNQKWLPAGFETQLVSGQKWQGSMRILHLHLVHYHVGAAHAIWIAQICCALQGECGRPNRKSMYLAGSLLQPKIAPKMAANRYLKLTWFLVKNGWRSIAFFSCSCGYAAQAIWIARICSALQGECGRPNRKSHVPGRLPVGAQN